LAPASRAGVRHSHSMNWCCASPGIPWGLDRDRRPAWGHVTYTCLRVQTPPLSVRRTLTFELAWIAALGPELSHPYRNSSGWIASGQVRTPAVFPVPLADAAEAHRLLETGATTGKVVLKP